MKSVTVTILPLLLLSYSPPTHACDCEGPGCRFLQTGGEIPANSQGLAWFCTCFHPAKKHAGDKYDVGMHFEIVRIGKGGEHRLGTEIKQISKGLYFLRAKEGLTAGERYRFGFRYGNSRLWSSVEVTAGKQRVLPMKKPAELKICPLEMGEVTLAGGAACSVNMDAGKRTIGLVLPPTAELYKQALLFETTVDGKPWHPESNVCSNIATGRSWQEIGTDLLFTLCDEKSYLQVLKPGFHRVRMLASMPGVGVIADSGEVEVLLKCGVN